MKTAIMATSEFGNAGDREIKKHTLDKPKTYMGKSRVQRRRFLRHTWEMSVAGMRFECFRCKSAKLLFKEAA